MTDNRIFNTVKLITKSSEELKREVKKGKEKTEKKKRQRVIKTDR